MMPLQQALAASRKDPLREVLVGGRRSEFVTRASPYVPRALPAYTNRTLFLARVSAT